MIGFTQELEYAKQFHSTLTAYHNNNNNNNNNNGYITMYSIY